ncbi:MAG: PorV/PorQ family protein [Ignavibacteriae bacterium]|nr:PorV/PorQ family protein [Ignavibacteriota bacterium]
MNTLRAILFTFVAAALCGTGIVFAQSTGSGLAGAYLLRPVGARAIGLGGAYTAIANEPTGLFYNPAFSAFLPDRPQISLMTSPLEFGRTHASVVYAQSIGSQWGISAGMNSFYNGSFQATNAQGSSLGNFSNQQYDIVLGGSWRNDFFAVGANAKYLIDALTGSGSTGKTFAFDFGAKVNLIDILTFGMAIQNIGGRYDWNSITGSKDIIPFTIRAGVATEIGINQEEYVVRSTIRGEPETIQLPSTQYVLLGLDAVYNQHDKSPTLVLGAEYSPMALLAVRVGGAVFGEKSGQNKFLPLTQWGGGLSVKPTIEAIPFLFSVEYAISGDAVSGSGVAHHISLIMQF